MPNQRKEGKGHLSQWITKGNKTALYAEAERRGVPVAVMLDEILKKEIKKLNQLAISTDGANNKPK